ncbi:MAG: threonine dehydratase [Actinobacteria bacterium]|nr:threonine dehydratase [Actinomycetota bacterium]
MFTIDDLRAATEVVRRVVPPTPQYQWPLLSARLGPGVEAWVKHENATPAGAFKVRGGLVYVDRLVRDRPDVRGLISATRGNHGQSIAIAGVRAGLPVTIVVPFGNSPDKNAAMRAWGAELIEHGRDFQEAREHAAALAGERGLEMVPSFHPDLVLGVATYALELFEAVSDLDAVYVPIGMVSGACGLMAARNALGLSTEIVGVVASAAPATALSFDAGHVVCTDDADTFIDGVACRVPDPTAIELIIAGCARVVQVGEDQCAEAMRVLLETTHQMPEPAGAVATAAMLLEADRLAGTRVATIMTGGNLDAHLLRDVLAGRTPTA